jgi:hypothetical protein
MRSKSMLTAMSVVLLALFLFGVWALKVELEYRRNIRNGFPYQPRAVEYSNTSSTFLSR